MHTKSHQNKRNQTCIYKSIESMTRQAMDEAVPINMATMQSYELELIIRDAYTQRQL